MYSQFSKWNTKCTFVITQNQRVETNYNMPVVTNNFSFVTPTKNILKTIYHHKRYHIQNRFLNKELCKLENNS